MEKLSSKKLALGTKRLGTAIESCQERPPQSGTARHSPLYFQMGPHGQFFPVNEWGWCVSLQALLALMHSSPAADCQHLHFFSWRRSSRACFAHSHKQVRSWKLSSSSFKWENSEPMVYSVSPNFPNMINFWLPAVVPCLIIYPYLLIFPPCLTPYSALPVLRHVSE